MYRKILIATDGSALAEKAVIHGLSLAKSVGANVIALIVEPPFNVYDVPESRIQQMGPSNNAVFVHDCEPVRIASGFQR
jgi:nucleotide-binding universal stress UspA family protein